MPRSLGGHELDPASIVEIVEQLSWADGSAGWTVLIGNSVLFFAWLEPAVVRELLGPAPDAISTGVFAPLGRARPAGDGRLLVSSGRWPFNSGCLHADWYEVGILVMDGEAWPSGPTGARTGASPTFRPPGPRSWTRGTRRGCAAPAATTWSSTGWSSPNGTRPCRCSTHPVTPAPCWSSASTASPPAC